METPSSSSSKEAQVNDYIIAKFSGKKNFHYYVGLVLKVTKKELLVKLLKNHVEVSLFFPRWKTSL